MSDLDASNNFHILVVDDEETARTSLGEILRLEGYSVDTAADGGAAITMINRQIMAGTPFDLVLLDLIMPGVDGIEVIHTITQTIPEPSDINRPTIILLTAHGSLESAIEALRFGAHDYLIKPSSPNQIINSIERALEVRKERKQKINLLNELEVSIKRLKSIGEPEVTTATDDGIKVDINGKKAETNYYHIGNRVKIELARREIIFNDLRNEKQVFRLTPTEGRLMQVFLEHPKRVFTHRELVALVQGYDIKDWEAAEVLRPLVSRLRRKLSKIPGGDAWIVSIRGTGYVFDPSVE